MSCSVVAIPWAIAWIVGGIASQAAIAAAAGGVFDDGGKALMKALETNKGEVCDSLAKQFLEKSFETPFVDKELLFKTLEEHGVADIHEDLYGKISGKSGNFILNFVRSEEGQPYNVLIKYRENADVDNEMENLNSEYAINVQEAAYNDIIENIEKHNMEIESEEVCDDNTIVLTINLE